MSDSFADLWNSSAPSKPAPAQTLGSKSRPGNGTHRSQNDVFALLAASRSQSQSASRTSTPAMTSPVQSQKSNVSLPLTSSARPAGDSFSDLLSGSLSTTSSNSGAHLTIAQRAALAEKERSRQLGDLKISSPEQSSTWAGLDSLGQSTPATAVTKDQNLIPDDDWGLGDFSSQPVAQKLSSPANRSTELPSTLWDMEEFTSPIASSSQAHSPPPAQPQRSDSPGDFDFGNREDVMQGHDSDDASDILGNLSKPVTSKNMPSGTSNMTARNRPSVTTHHKSRDSSPPPHIVGQIVEMGFSPQQARTALLATESGLDVQAAMEILLGNASASGSSVDPTMPTRNNNDVSEDASEYRQRHRPKPASQPPLSPRTRATGHGQDINLQEQADKLLAQASELGMNMFSRANAFWNQSKEKAQKLYEERAAAARAAAAPSPRDGRPRWMQDDAPKFDDEDVGKEARNGSPADDVRSQKQAKPETRSAPDSNVDIFSMDAPLVYKSPFRHGRPVVRADSAVSQPPPSNATPARPPSTVTPVQRQVVSASRAAMDASAKYKSAGTEMFKLGQYGEAETAYTAAIAELPDSHLLLIPLYNNRALVRIKIGNYKGAIDDGSSVITMIGPSFHPAREAKIHREEDGAGVDLGDALTKARRRRAEAYEGSEKWELAQKDWEIVAGIEWAPSSTRNEAVRGIGRCRKMLNFGNDRPASTPTPMPVKPRPVQSKTTPQNPQSSQPSEALDKFREANKAAEAEDEAKHKLKDVIDARLNAWKGGKENNIRALIASLDTVLWPELGWQKIGMGDLITPSQVKIRYTKAIAKLHPDKLNVNNTTLEQRMIANGVFGTLNEAWNSFKQ